MEEGSPPGGGKCDLAPPAEPTVGAQGGRQVAFGAQTKSPR
jgi:hypothetical protein